MPVTLEDIAAATGCDKSTVSVTLRDLPRAKRFSKATRARITEAAERLGYRPNFFARALSDQKPRLLMLCVNYLRDPFAMMVAEGFEARAVEQGIRVLITALQDRQDPLELHRDMLGMQGVPALAAIGGASSKLSDESLIELADEGVNVVLVNRRVVHPRIAYVGADEQRGGTLVAEHLFDRGVRKTWILKGFEGPAAEAREQAIRAVASNRGMPEPHVLQCAPSGIDWATAAYNAVFDALKTDRPEAILTVSDVLAVGAERALAARGLLAGRDVAVTGYDDGLYAQCSWPPLTTVRLPMPDMGRAAAQSLISMLEHPGTPQPDAVLPVELVVRESSASFTPVTPDEQSRNS